MQFYKYNATGNDFILIDARKDVSFSTEQVKKLCHRRFGIGADGIILLGFSKEADFSMRIINSDGSEAAMCGNGTRALIHFAHFVLKLKTRPEYKFTTLNGLYEGSIEEKDEIRIKMTELYDVDKYKLDTFPGKRALYLNTGVPHFVIEVDDLASLDIEKLSPPLRHHAHFPEGANIDYFQMIDDICHVRTFERGVEGETYACGTGVVATAETVRHFYHKADRLKLMTKGGALSVEWKNNDRFFIGSVDLVYKGELNAKYA
jgi:diaminopimelate epimerase